MQKSKKMMVSLCGLALSSLFVLNNKSVVHADSVTDGSQNNAISWNSDSDAAQNVQNTQKAGDDQQNAQSVQPSRAEMSTVRSSSAAPRTTNQTAAVQSPRVSNVQDAQVSNPIVINNPAGDKVHVHYIDSNGNAVDNSTHDYDIDATKTGQASYTVPNGYSLNNPDGKYNVNGGKFGADTLKGNVEHHAAVTHKVTQWAEYDDDGQYKTIYGMSDYAKKHAEQEYKDHVLAETGDGAPKWQKQTKTITDKPAYDVQHLPVAFVDSSNNIVGMIQNYTGKAGTSQNINLSLPTGYKLADGATLPTSVSFQNSTNPLLVKVVPNGKTQSISTDSMHVHFVDQSTGKAVGGDYTISVNDNGSYYYQTPQGYGADHNGYRTSVSTSTEYTGLSAINMTYPDDSSISFSMSNNAIKQMYDYFGKDASVAIGPRGGVSASNGGTTVSVYDFDHTGNGKRVLIDPDDADIPEWQRELSNQVSYSRFQLGQGAIWLLSPKTTQVATSRRFTDNLHDISGNTVTVPVHKTNSFSFADNSGNVKSVNGNTVDVTLTKPQSVNPAMDTRCHSQAMRTIQINFPDGQIPQSYDGIVDKSGKLVQTVYFTRTATEDALTGNILQYGNWTSDNQDHNFIGFPERTLPRIPGYTLSIKPA